VTIGENFTGPEVIKQEITVLKKANELFKLNFRLINVEGGGEYYLQRGKE
jgi:isocitrate/isopropylmalate dehydrogenase